MGTKTEEYLKILAEGGDAPTSCCMTNTQKLIAEAIERINNLTPGGGGDSVIVPLSDYIDPQTGNITDLDGITEAINAGKGFYTSGETSMLGQFFGETIFNGSIANGVITLSGTPIIRSTLPTGGAIASISLNFDATTGGPTSNPIEGTMFMLPHSTTAQGQTSLSLGKLTLNIGNDTYEYDGTQDVNITILDGENMGF